MTRAKDVCFIPLIELVVEKKKDARCTPTTKPHEKEEEEALHPGQRMRIFMPRARLNIDAEYHLSPYSPCPE